MVSSAVGLKGNMVLVLMFVVALLGGCRNHPSPPRRIVAPQTNASGDSLIQVRLWRVRGAGQWEGPASVAISAGTRLTDAEILASGTQLVQQLNSPSRATTVGSGLFGPGISFYLDPFGVRVISDPSLPIDIAWERPETPIDNLVRETLAEPSTAAMLVDSTNGISRPVVNVFFAGYRSRGKYAEAVDAELMQLYNLGGVAGLNYGVVFVYDSAFGDFPSNQSSAAGAGLYSSSPDYALPAVAGGPGVLLTDWYNVLAHETTHLLGNWAWVGDRFEGRTGSHYGYNQPYGDEHDRRQTGWSFTQLSAGRTFVPNNRYRNNILLLITLSDIEFNAEKTAGTLGLTSPRLTQIPLIVPGNFQGGPQIDPILGSCDRDYIERRIKQGRGFSPDP